MLRVFRTSYTQQGLQEDFLLSAGSSGRLPIHSRVVRKTSYTQQGLQEDFLLLSREYVDHIDMFFACLLHPHQQKKVIFMRGLKVLKLTKWTCSEQKIRFESLQPGNEHSLEYHMLLAFCLINFLFCECSTTLNMKFIK